MYYNTQAYKADQMCCPHRPPLTSNLYTIGTKDLKQNLKFSLQRISVYSGFKGFLFIQVSNDFCLFRFQRISVYSGFKGFLFIQVSKDFCLFRFQRISVYSVCQGFLFIQVSKDFCLFRFQLKINFTVLIFMMSQSPEKQRHLLKVRNLIEVKLQIYSHR